MEIGEIPKGWGSLRSTQWVAFLGYLSRQSSHSHEIYPPTQPPSCLSHACITGFLSLEVGKAAFVKARSKHQLLQLLLDSPPSPQLWLLLPCTSAKLEHHRDWTVNTKGSLKRILLMGEGRGHINSGNLSFLKQRIPKGKQRDTGRNSG